jgi:hypothetical protein
MIEKGLEIKNKISRREFLKLLGAMIVSVFMPGSAKKITRSIITANKESKEKVSSSKILVLDFFNLLDFKAEILEKHFPEDFSEADKLDEIGIQDPNSVLGIKQGVPQTEVQARLFFLKALELHYKNHGNDVVDILKETSALLFPDQTQEQIQSQIESYSMADAVEFGVIEKDATGNFKMHLNLNKDLIAKMIKSSNQDVVSLSLELGRSEISYKAYGETRANPEAQYPISSSREVNGTTTYTYYNSKDEEITEQEHDDLLELAEKKELKLLKPDSRSVDHIDGYEISLACDNLRLMAELANQFPNKFFVVAGGNPSGSRFPDIREAKKKLQDENLWPENNLVVVGVVGPGPYDFYGKYAHGSDIYVRAEDIESLGKQPASSFATPIVAELVRIIKSSGIKQIKLKEALFLFSKQVGLDGRDEDRYEVVDLSLVKNYVQGNKK